MSSLIHLHDICKSYQLGNKQLPVLKNINLDIQNGELVAIMGESGSGKTTLMNLLGLLDSADSGLYQLNNQDIATFSEDERASTRGKTIGFVFQSFYLLPKLNALQNISLPLRYQHITTTKAHERAKTMLEKVHMSEFHHHKPNELSGGQQQRVAIARALVSNPSVILADEPTGALDTKTSQDIMRLFLRLNEEENRTVVIITHDPHISAQCQRVIRIRDGEIIE